MASLLVRVAAGLAILVGSPLPALAEAAKPSSDIPPDHPAAQAVEDLVYRFQLMPLADDGVFRGDEPLTRMELIQTFWAFVRRIEEQSKRSLAGPSIGTYSFEDLEESGVRTNVERLANQYYLLEGIPNIDPTRLGSRRPVRRAELAALLSNTIGLLEKKRVIPKPRVGELMNPFKDLRRKDWAYEAILNVTRRHPIMAGFTDGTFRGGQELTRYQFAIDAAPAFEAVQELASGVVRQRLPRGPLEGTSFTKFRGDDPNGFSVGALWTFNLPGVTSPVERARGQYGGLGGALLSWRWVDYPPISESAIRQYRDWTYPESRFGLSQFDLIPVPPKAGGITAPLVGGVDAGVMGLYSSRSGINDRNPEPFHIQPFVGWLALGDFALGLGGDQGDVQVGGGAGPLAGTILHHRIADQFAYSLSIETGIAGYAGFRQNTGKGLITFTGKSKDDVATAQDTLEVSGLPPQWSVPLLVRPYLRLGMGLQQFSRPNSTFGGEIVGLVLPGGLHDDPASLTTNFAALAAGVTFGVTWR